MKKAKPKYDFLSVRIENDVTKELDARAKKRGLSRSKAIREALEWYLGLSDEYVRAVTAYSTLFAVPTPVVMENLARETMARRYAEDRVMGGPVLVEEFPKQLDGTPITGPEFREMREAVWTHHYTQKLADQENQERLMAELAAQGQE